MILAVAALLLQFPAFTVVRNAPLSLPSQPSTELKVATPHRAVSATGAVPGPATGADGDTKLNPQPVRTLTAPPTAKFSDVYVPPPPAFRPPNETPVVHHKLWFVLTSAEHGAATYDAWSTRRAIDGGRVEADPVMRPFAGSAAIYGAIQVVPFGLDYLAHRLQRSSGWAHHIWWVPQSAATVTFLFSGSYNVAHTD